MGGFEATPLRSTIQRKDDGLGLLYYKPLNGW